MALIRVRNLARTLLGPVRWNQLKLALGRVDRNTFYDSLTEEILRRHLREDSICVDVGCHAGVILSMMIRFAPKGKFYAFEPLPHLYHGLVEAFRGQNVTLYDVALSDAKGTSSFNYVISNPAYSGFVKRRYDRPHEDDATITVRKNLLDDLIDPGDRVSLIKIDVEGAELQVLRGATKTIKRDRPVVVFEHGLGAADLYGSSPEDLYDLLCGECGLSVSLLHRYLLGHGVLSKSEFRAQFERSRNYYFVAHSP
jgi:FkbM family methyltransferase